MDPSLLKSLDSAVDFLVDQLRHYVIFSTDEEAQGGDRPGWLTVKEAAEIAGLSSSQISLSCARRRKFLPFSRPVSA
jgi:hypothetical protein